MKTVKYKEYNLATNSEAYQLYETWQKMTKEEDKKFYKRKLDAHLKELDRKYKELHGD